VRFDAQRARSTAGSEIQFDDVGIGIHDMLDF
jgi:hypothetical protein